MARRLSALQAHGVGWCAGYSEDLHPERSPERTSPIGPTTILARTELMRAAPMGGLVQGEDYTTAVGITSLAPGIVLPVPVYRYRKHEGSLSSPACCGSLD
ncbi:hypothetical protein ACFVT2_21675 [Streptomyces sp. NPDC058000]|uniref:hypothetical protein n=1 Tax=Streptomyces sp. NPDC058000 TaxID=3346299 RepID=UPI0036EC005F